MPFLQSQEDTLSLADIYTMSLEELLQIKVTVSSTNSLSVFNTPSTVTIIDHEMIEEYGFLSLAEALNTVAGIDVLQTIIDKNVTSSRGILQNFYANKVLLMINNVPTWQPIYGDGHLERINLNDVKQIEVLKGPASVLYGSNAYSAVINIKLKETEETTVSVNGFAGYPGIGSGTVNVFYAKDDFKLLIGAHAWNETRKPFEVEGANYSLYNDDSVFTYTDIYNKRSFNINMRYKSHTLLFNNFDFHHSFLGSAPSYASGGNNIVYNEGTLIAYNFKRNLKGNLCIIANSSFDYFKRKFPLSPDKQMMIHLAGYRASGELKLNYRISESFKLEVGTAIDNRTSLGHEARSGISDTLIRSNLLNDEDVLEWSAFAQVDFKYRFLNILAGSRYTSNQHFGENVSSRVSSLFNISEKQSVKLIFGQSFRVPTMFELYFNHPTVIGNSGLKPETSTSYELAYLIGYNNFYVQALGYYAKYDNLIQRITPMSGPPSEYQNANSFEGHGIETELRYQNPEIINAFINYNFIDGDDNGEENNFRFVPDHTISFGLSKNFDKFTVSTNGRWYSKVDGHLAEIPAQFSINAQIRYKHQINRYNFSHAIIASNITNCNTLTPEYIRQTPNVNALETTGYGSRFIYKVSIDF